MSISTPPPAPALRELVSALRRPGTLVRTATVLLDAAHVAPAATAWATELQLEAQHLGRAVLASVQAVGTRVVALSAERLREYVDAQLPTQQLGALPSGGVWLWGAEALLTKLDDTQRLIFWEEMRTNMPHRPPLVLALPQHLARFGPPQPESWGGRYLSLPAL
ncbi:hypothetical protein KLP40_16695 [Hymenobacter sp. NST-14]|uniref:hypothetical protein n=1 Tax=Hymenobacter piscis TaxID=2839984 RepID=UPI001C00E6D0|nr:hypothetical protein [Hymenobacter piscis]MBT9394807.1 hypothetical protein [Hymenobacter piscis]